MKLWIVRHAKPLIESGVCYGALDVAADAPHTLQAASSRPLPARFCHSREVNAAVEGEGGTLAGRRYDRSEEVQEAGFEAS